MNGRPGRSAPVERIGAGQPPGTGYRWLPIDDRILDMLAAHDGPAGIYPSIPRLGALLGVSGRYVRQRLAALEGAGLVQRVAVFECDDDPEWRQRGHRSSHPGRQTSSAYRLVQFRGPPGTPTNPVEKADAQVNPPELTVPDSRVSSALEGKEPAGGGYQGSRDEGERDAAPHQPAAVSAVLEVGAQHEPSWADLRLDADGILDQLRAQLGDVEVLSVTGGSQPATVYRTVRGRRIDLTGGPHPTGPRAVQDLHQALVELDAHTCRRTNGGGERCTPGQPCGRHTPRRRTRPARPARPPPGPRPRTGVEPLQTCRRGQAWIRTPKGGRPVGQARPEQGGLCSSTPPYPASPTP